MSLDDAGFLLRQLTQQSWIANIGDRGVRSIEDAAAYIESRTFVQYRTFGFGMNVVELKSGDEAIGVCGLVKRDYLPFPDLGFALLEGFWGQGYAEEAASCVMEHALNELAIPRLLAITTPGNERSGRLLGKLGFEIENNAYLTPEGATLRLYSTREARVATVAAPAAETGPWSAAARQNP